MASEQNPQTVTLNAFSRVLASVLLMLAFGIGGSYLDKWTSSGFWTICGFLMGGVLMLIGMVYAVRAAEVDRQAKNQENKAHSGDE